MLEVTDGDTVEVRAYGARRKRYDVRLIGIDTPEKYGGRECGSAQASASMTSLAEGRRVTLVTDPSQDLVDRYGRLLAYVIRGDGLDLNQAQARRGWATVYVYQGNAFRRVRAFRRAQSAARRANRGVWRRCGDDFHKPN